MQKSWFRSYRPWLLTAVLFAAFWLVVLQGPASTTADGTQLSYLPVFYRQPTPTPLPGWYVEYYGNRDLSGTPHTARYEQYDYPEKNWSSGAPVAGLPVDNFSVRFTASKSFDAGSYAFFTSSDDGCRLYVDGVLRINQWRDSNRGTATYRYPDGGGSVYMSAGTHEIRLEYYEHGGGARARCFWINQDLYPEWRAEYWGNESLTGTPALVRNESELDHSWGTGSPATGVPSDGFSARWTRAFWFTEGKYVFYTTADDGARLWVDKWASGDQTIDDWAGGPERTSSQAQYLAESGWYLVTITYHEATQAASCSYWHLYGGASGSFVGQYYAGENFDELWGVRNDGEIDFDWGSDRPEGGGLEDGMPKDHFSVRWTHCMSETEGAYRFTATVDDGCRVWLDGYDDDHLVIDEWRGCDGEEVHGDVALHQGWHVVIMEYYEGSGDAEAKLSWEESDQVQLWRADYVNGIHSDFTGLDPVYTEYTDALDVNVGLDSPAPGVDADNWSARFKQQVYFDRSGTYRFTVWYDGGAKLYVKNEERFDDWGNTDYEDGRSSSVNLSKGYHWVKVHYVDRGGNGRVWLTIAKQ